jgi:hypothetical protein
MEKIAAFFASVQGFFTTAIGSGLVAFGLSYPVDHQYLVNGQWIACDPTLLQSQCSGVARPVNLLGMSAWADYGNTAAILALCIAGVLGAVAAGLGSLAKTES